MPAVKDKTAKQFDAARLNAVLKEMGWSAKEFARRENININTIYGLRHKPTYGLFGESKRLCEAVKKWEKRIRDAAEVRARFPAREGEENAGE